MENKKPAREVALQQYDINAPEKMVAMSKVLKEYVVKNKLYSNIKGKNYVHVEGWQFAGGLMGLFSKVSEVENLSSSSEYKWKATAEIINTKTNVVMATGFALCSSKEGSKKSFDEYAILSMAQTRAIGKGYRNLVGWVMKLAGYEGTPSEEMHKVGEIPREPQESSGEEKQEHPIEDHVCQTLAKGGCGRDITAAEAAYSKKLYGRELCREHQKSAKRK